MICSAPCNIVVLLFVIIFLFLVAESPPGVYLYLGYSKKDSLILQRGRVKLGKDVPDTEEEERKEVKDTVQQTVSHFTSNTNKVI